MRVIAVSTLCLAACGTSSDHVLARSAQGAASLRGGGGAAVGRVLLDGKPAKGIRISLSGAGYWHTVTTAADGTWKVGGLDPGTYTFFYENPADDKRVTFWHGPYLKLGAGKTLRFDAIDVGHWGVPTEPPQNARLDMPAHFAWTSYPEAKDYGFEVLSGTDRHAQLLFRPDHRVAPKFTRIVFEGNVNVAGEPHVMGTDYLGKRGGYLVPGHTYAWNVVWKAADGGQGAGPLGTFRLHALAKAVFPKAAPLLDQSLLPQSAAATK